MPTERCSTGTLSLLAKSNRPRPSTEIDPASGVSSPAMQRKVVVLPQPDGPSMVKKVPGSSAKFASRIPPAIWSVEFSKTLVRRSTRSIRTPPSRTPKRAARGAARDEIEHHGNGGHQHRPHQAERGELGALPVA